MMMGEIRKIARLQIRDFLGIEALDLEPSEGGTVVSGKNLIGKTALLQAIEVGLSNKGYRTRPIRNGADVATILITLDDEPPTTIERTITRGKGAGSVKVMRGATTLSSPQAVLNKLFPSQLVFNPVRFCKQSLADQTKQLLSLIDVEVGEAEYHRLMDISDGTVQVDYTGHPLLVLGAIEKVLRDERHGIGVLARKQAAVAEELAAEVPPEFDAAAARAVDVSALAAERSEIDAHNELRRQKMLEVADLEKALDENALSLKTFEEKAEARIAELDREIARLRERIEEERRNATDKEAVLLAEQDKVKAWLDAPDNMVRSSEQVQAQLAGHTQTMRDLAKYDAAMEAAAERDKLKDQYEQFNARIEEVRAMPRKLLENAELPVEGLGVDEDGNITVKGQPLGNLSDSEQIMLSVQVAEAMAGDLKLVLADGLEALDLERRSEFLDRLAETDLQYIVSVVDAGELQISTWTASADEQ